MCTEMARDKVLAAARFLEDATTQAESSLPGCIGPVTGLYLHLLVVRFSAQDRVRAIQLLEHHDTRKFVRVGQG